MQFDIGQLVNSIFLMLKAAVVTFQVSILGAVLGIGVGLVLIFMRMMSFRIANVVAEVYISFMRGTPLLIQIFLFYYALPGLLRIDLPPFIAGVMSLSLNSGAFVTEILRAGINSIPQGQMEGAKALGLRKRVIWIRIVLPQVFAKILPPLTNEFTMLIKASSLLSVITVVELTRTAQQIMAVTYRPVEALLAAAALYFTICFVLSALTRRLEQRNILVRGGT